MAETRRFAGIASRSQLRAANNLGVIFQGGQLKQKFRKNELDSFDAYYEERQYAGLSSWDTSAGEDGAYVPVRQRAPRIQYAFAKVLTARLGAKLVGSRTFPMFKVESDPDTDAYLAAVVKISRIKAYITEPVRRMLASGSSFLRFYITEGQYKLQCYLAKWCYPEFDDAGNLESIRIQYVFSDEKDLDKQNKPKQKWYKLELSKNSDILYDNPDFTGTNAEPNFKVVSKVDHNLGFVQGEWFKTSEESNSIDGCSMIEPVTDFIDELNYSLSQSSTAIQYNQDPQLAINSMDEDELDKLIKSASKAWNLGKDGKAQFLEAGMKGVETAITLRDKMRQNVQDVTRVIMLEPEKMSTHAQSGRAMEILHGPMVELVEELRPMLEKSLTSFIVKMALANLTVAGQGSVSPIIIPDGYQPQSFDITTSWPEIFPPTMDDLKTKVSIATSVSSANIFSRETMMKWLAKDFGVENIEEELAKIASQPIMNPFGSFGGGGEPGGHPGG